MGSSTQLKQSIQRDIRKGILAQYPMLEPFADDLLPKKTPMFLAKCRNHINIYLIDNVPLFFTIFEGKENNPFFPTLKLLHQYPDILPHMQVDRGAVKFIMSGANIMCPGLTSEGAKMDLSVQKEKPVAIMVEGKKHAL